MGNGALMGQDKILTVENLKKRYENASENTLENLCFSVENREFVCILGPSGCGKTTMLRCIAGLEEYEGNITVTNVTGTDQRLDRIVVFQDFNQLFPWKTVLENITYVLKRKGIQDKSQRKEQALAMLKRVELSDYQDYYPHQLSGGMKQRVAIARALVLKPRLILMDEPFASLDAMTRRKLQRELLGEFEQNDVAILFITHNIQEAVVLGTRIIAFSKKGAIVYDKKNPLRKPVTPDTPGYGEVWAELADILDQK